jgi:tetratricopeptide (TPR) repeat protein
MNAGFKSIVLVAAFMLFFGRKSDAFTPSTDSRSVGLVRSMRLSGLTVYMVSSAETQKERREALGSIKALHPDEQRTKLRRKYKRQREKPPTEKEVELLKKRRQEEFENLVALKPANVWSFESLFPKPVFDETSIQEDLFGVAERDKTISKQTEVQATEKAKKKGSGGSFSKGLTKIRTSTYGGSSIMTIWREPKLGSNFVPSQRKGVKVDDEVSEEIESDNPLKSWNEDAVSNLTVDRDMTQKVEGAVFGIRRTKSGDYEYDTSLVSDGAVKFRDGVRLGQALKINADLLNYNAKKEMAHGRLEEAQELYERALATDPRDGRAYLGLSRIAKRRRDFKLARNILRSGITESVSVDANGEPDLSGNPFLLQALGCLEEKTGHLSQAEALYIAAVKSRPSHAASWVSLAQLRTRKLRQNAAAGRLCFQTAERELKKAGLPPSSYVYTAWASLEYKKAGDARRARELFQAALDVDPSCSVAYLQLGVMESDKENWEVAEKCFERALKFDKRNSRILQAFAIMESRRPDGSSRRTIDLFERALKANPRDAGVLQAYALFVAKLGDFDTARSL